MMHTIWCMHLEVKQQFRSIIKLQVTFVQYLLILCVNGKVKTLDPCENILEARYYKSALNKYEM